MSDNQLPKATMANFIRDRIKEKKKVSAEFTNIMLDLSKGNSSPIQNLLIKYQLMQMKYAKSRERKP